MTKLRSLFKQDMPRLLEIEETVHVVPWTKETFNICFEAGYLGWVVEVEKNLSGFIIVSLRNDECHILNLCVARDSQRNGYGQTLLKHALKHAKQKGAGIVYLEVRRSNSPAIALYRKMKFHLIGERKDYYPGIAGMEDALVFAKSLHDEA